jgi:glycosyltransferase involved in cell wall biosynthesis
MNDVFPSLTIVIPHFNHGHLIAQQLDAILAQSVQPTKIIIIDDASTDDSVAVIKKQIFGHSNIELLCNKVNSGVVAVNNQGLYLADTEFITFPAADDILMPGFIEKSLNLLCRYPEAALCSTITLIQYGAKEWYIPNWRSLPCATPEFLSPQKVSRLLMQVEGWIMSNTVILRREPLIELGGQFSELLSSADEFTYRVLALRHGACFVPEPLAINCQSSTSYSAVLNKNDAIREKVLINLNALMRNKFPDLFPAKLVARSNARSLFRILCGKLDIFEQQSQSLVKEIQPIERGSFVLSIIRWMVVVLKLMYFCVLRFHDTIDVVLTKLWRKRPTKETKE